MPIRSKAQQRAMYAAANGKSKTGIPRTVAKEFIESTPKKAYTALPERAKPKVALKRTGRK